MIKLILSLFVAVIFTIFASQNMEPIFIHFVMGSPVRVPTIVVVFSAFMLGMIVTLFFTIAARTKSGKGMIEDDDED
ncbi:MAG TPA: hypothetical protein HPP54_06365 [Nitrospinae bacterium]|nr:hypothetical protein [Nitrospinota bacterium]